MKKINNIGYACMNLDTYPSSFRTCRLKNLNENIHRELIEHNLDVLESMIDYNILNKVKLYRISSSLIPFASSKECTLYWKSEFKERLIEIGQKINSYKMRISVHPGQYTIINSPKYEVVENSIKELKYHCDILEALQADKSCKIILHIGGMYKDKKSAIKRFVENYKTLPSEVKERLVIENDDKIFNIEDALQISSMTGVPVIYDNLHHFLLPSMYNLNEGEILEKVICTWNKKERPKIHYSQQAVGKPKGSHSSTINLKKFIEDYENTYKYFDIDIMLEVKDKNRSFKKVDLYINPGAEKFQEEWARYKYLIMSKSYEDYQIIRKMFKNQNTPCAENFYNQIDISLEKESSLKNEVNTFEHMWGYFKNKAELKEKIIFFKKLNEFKSGQVKAKVVIKELYKLAKKYNEGYILSSYILKWYGV